MEAQEPATSVTVDVGGTPPEPPYARAALTWNKVESGARAPGRGRGGEGARADEDGGAMGGAAQEHTLNEEKHYCYCGGGKEEEEEEKKGEGAERRRGRGVRERGGGRRAFSVD